MHPDLPPGKTRPLSPKWPRIALWVLCLAVVVICLSAMVHEGIAQIRTWNMSAAQTGMSGLLIAALILYALLLAIPFMPGVEVGIALLLLQGAAIAPFVYLATMSGLMLAFLIGRLVPLAWLYRFFHDLGLQRGCAFVEDLQTKPLKDRLSTQRAVLPTWITRLTVDYRYISIGILLNVPGTFAIGGGGGIMMVAGLSQRFGTLPILATLSIFTLPVPLTVWLFGVGILK